MVAHNKYASTCEAEGIFIPCPFLRKGALEKKLLLEIQVDVLFPLTHTAFIFSHACVCRQNDVINSLFEEENLQVFCILETGSSLPWRFTLLGFALKKVFIGMSKR